VVLKDVVINQTPTGVELGAFAYVYFSQTTITNVDGFPLTDGVCFDNNVCNQALSDGTSHLTPTNGSIGHWSVQ
jgi:hypothetical protein